MCRVLVTGIVYNNEDYKLVKEKAEKVNRLIRVRNSIRKALYEYGICPYYISTSSHLPVVPNFEEGDIFVHSDLDGKVSYHWEWKQKNQLRPQVAFLVR